MINEIKNTKLFIFDLDGTVYIDGKLIGNAKNTLQALRNNGAKIAYLTNNSSRTNKAYIERLKGLDILEKEDRVYSSLDCAQDFLLKYRAGKKVYAVASDECKNYLANNGVVLTEEDNADVVLLAFDTTLTYDKIEKMNRLLVYGAEYIATHPDVVCPASPISVPDVGSFIAMIKLSSGREPDIILGKPYSYMADFLVSGYNLDKSQVTMVGDRLNTDIMFGVNAGINTVLVLTGETTLEAYEKSGIKVTHVLKDLNELKNLL